MSFLTDKEAIAAIKWRAEKRGLDIKPVKNIKDKLNGKYDNSYFKVISDKERLKASIIGGMGGRVKARAAYGFEAMKDKEFLFREKTFEEGRELAKKMTKKYDIPEDAFTQEALAFANSVVLSKVDGTKDRLAAARLILDFCKVKPASKQEVTLNAAEDFLKAIAEEEEDNGQETTEDAEET